MLAYNNPISAAVTYNNNQPYSINSISMSQPYTVAPFQLHRQATIIPNQPRQNCNGNQNSFKQPLNEPPPNYEQLMHQNLTNNIQNVNFNSEHIVLPASASVRLENPISTENNF